MNTQPLFSDVEDIKMHIATLWQIASADGRVLESETEFINNVLAIYSKLIGVENAADFFEDAKKISVAEIDIWKNKLKKHPVQARNFIKDLITLAYVDQAFCESEKVLTDKIAAEIGMTQSIVEQMTVAVWQIMNATICLNQLIYNGEEAKA